MIIVRILYSTFCSTTALFDNPGRGFSWLWQLVVGLALVMSDMVTHGVVYMHISYLTSYVGPALYLQYVTQM